VLEPADLEAAGGGAFVATGLWHRATPRDDAPITGGRRRSAAIRSSHRPFCGRRLGIVDEVGKGGRAASSTFGGWVARMQSRTGPPARGSQPRTMRSSPSSTSRNPALSTRLGWRRWSSHGDRRTHFGERGCHDAADTTGAHHEDPWLRVHFVI